MAQILLTQDEALKAFYDSLCNVYDSGWFSGYGLKFECDDKAYDAARKKLKDAGVSPCIEDVYLQIVKDGGELKVVDMEGEGENNGSFTLQKIVDNISTTPFDHMADYLNEQDDITTADVILQSILYREVIFG